MREQDGGQNRPQKQTVEAMVHIIHLRDEILRLREQLMRSEIKVLELRVKLVEVTGRRDVEI